MYANSLATSSTAYPLTLETTLTQPLKYVYVHPVSAPTTPPTPGK